VRTSRTSTHPLYGIDGNEEEKVNEHALLQSKNVAEKPLTKERGGR